MRARGGSCESRSRSQWTPLPAIHVFSQCPFRPWTETTLGVSAFEGKTWWWSSGLNNRVGALPHTLSVVHAGLHRLLVLASTAQALVLAKGTSRVPQEPMRSVREELENLSYYYLSSIEMVEGTVFASCEAWSRPSWVM